MQILFPSFNLNLYPISKTVLHALAIQYNLCGSSSYQAEHNAKSGPNHVYVQFDK